MSKVNEPTQKAVVIPTESETASDSLVHEKSAAEKRKGFSRSCYHPDEDCDVSEEELKRVVREASEDLAENPEKYDTIHAAIVAFTTRLGKRIKADPADEKRFINKMSYIRMKLNERYPLSTSDEMKTRWSNTRKCIKVFIQRSFYNVQECASQTTSAERDSSDRTESQENQLEEAKANILSTSACASNTEDSTEGSVSAFNEGLKRIEVAMPIENEDKRPFPLSPSIVKRVYREAVFVSSEEKFHEYDPLLNMSIAFALRLSRHLNIDLKKKNDLDAKLRYIHEQLDVMIPLAVSTDRSKRWRDIRHRIISGIRREQRKQRPEEAVQDEMTTETAEGNETTEASSPEATEPTEDLDEWSDSLTIDVPEDDQDEQDVPIEEHHQEGSVEPMNEDPIDTNLAYLDRNTLEEDEMVDVDDSMVQEPNPTSEDSSVTQSAEHGSVTQPENGSVTQSEDGSVTQSAMDGSATQATDASKENRTPGGGGYYHIFCHPTMRSRLSEGSTPISEKPQTKTELMES